MGTAGKTYSNLPMDDSNKGIMTGGGFVMADATGTPKNSPLAVSSAVITLIPPTNAAEVVFFPSAAMRVSNVVGMGTYFVIPASTIMAMPIGRTTAVYVIRDSGDLTLNFYFVTV